MTSPAADAAAAAGADAAGSTADTSTATTTCGTTTTAAAAVVSEVMNPLVFQCKTCRVVLGDSFSWLGADEELSAITLTTTAPHPAVKVESELKFATATVDAGRCVGWGGGRG